MRILLATEYFYPTSKGGTEMYVYQLAKELIKNGHECLIVSLSENTEPFTYEGIQIKYISFEINAYNDLVNPKNIYQLIEIVKEFKPDIFHLHTYTSSMGISHLLRVEELGIKIIFTSHLPNFTCLRGDLMLLGKEVCDGVVIKDRCMNCYLQSTGIKSVNNRKILVKASYFNLFRKLIPRLNQFDVKNKLLTTFKDKISNIVVVSHWQKTVLELNGFNSSNVDVCRQAINEENILHQKTSQPSAKLRIGFIGRIVQVKGLHVLLNALSDLDKAKFELTVVAVKSANEIEYYNTTKVAANAIDANWIEDLESSDIFKFLDNIDILAIPSIWLETGPIVAFEALARKLPLLAFNYGGVKELTNNSESYLVNNLEEMKSVLNEIINDKSKLQKKSDSINYVRTTKDLYLETINLYNKISS